MNTNKRLNDILNKFPKTELKKVELGIVDDIEKNYQKVKQQGDSVMSELSKVVSNLDGKIKSDIKSALDNVQKVEKMEDEIIRSAKDLGIDLPSKVKVAINQTEAYRSNLQNAQGQIDRAISSLLGAIS